MVSMFRSMGASRLRIFTKLRVSAALPNIFAGVKVGMSLSVVGAIVAEFVAADRGLGYYLIYANGQLEAVQRLFVPGALSKGAVPSQATM